MASARERISRRNRLLAPARAVRGDDFKASPVSRSATDPLETRAARSDATTMLSLSLTRITRYATALAIIR